MQDFIDFISGLLSTDRWPPRWKCGYWSDFHGWLYIISDLLIWAAYFTIPLIIINYILKKKAALKFNKAYIYFAAFILLCGSTHFLDAVMFWHPMYRLNALVRLITALVSLATVYHLIKILPQAFSQKTSLELEAEILRRKEAERKLLEANEGLKAFASMASHDLKEPLRKITSFTTILNSRNKDKFDEPSKQYADKIITSSERMHSLIEDILTLSSISDNIEMQNVDTTHVVKKAVEDLELKIKEKNARIDLGVLPPVKGNEGYLTQLFSNLIANSLKFSNRPPEIKISGEQIAGKVRIRVSDNGVGIEKENYQKIFEAFQRLHSKLEYEGTGIGLAICKKIVDMHKGEINVESKPGEGTTFTIVLEAANTAG